MKSFCSLFLLVVILACGNIEPNSGTHNNRRDVTNLSICRNQTPFGYSLFEQEWRQDVRDENGITYQQIFRFEPRMISMSVTCSTLDAQGTVFIQVASVIVGSQITATSSDSARTTFISNGRPHFCEAELDSGAQLIFSFEGPCLKLQENGRTRILVPTTL